jgi:hypothetical protein
MEITASLNQPKNGKALTEREAKMRNKKVGRR